jgi:hypothetical protein
MPRNESKSWISSNIAEHMDEVYYKLDIPLFAGLSDNEIDILVQNLLLAVKNKLTHDHHYILHPKARGVLHRLFHGEFAHISVAEDKGFRFVNAWLAKDPQVPKNLYPKAEDAYNQMLVLYSGFDLPFLKRSSLHWPSRKYRKYFKQRHQSQARRDQRSLEHHQEIKNGRRP